MDNIPAYVAWTFIAIVVAVFLFLAFGVYHANSSQKKSTPVIIVSVLGGWILFVSVLTFSGFFQEYSFPPRLMFFVGIPLLFILSFFIISNTRKFLLEIPITTLHYLHIIRVPVEMVLWWLSVGMIIPQIMTFEGANFDIISGISAPFAAVFLVGVRNKNRVLAIVWNLVALALLLIIVYIAISHTPYFYEGTEEVPANMGIFFFPYVLLPTFIVPAVLFSHLISLYQLIAKKE